MSPEQIRKICEEELFADLYAGIDNFNTRELRDTARAGFDEAQSRQQNTEAERDTRRPPNLGDENTVFANGERGLFSVSYSVNTVDADEVSRVKEQIKKNLDWLTREPAAAEINVDRDRATVRANMESDAVELFRTIGFHVDKQNYGDILVDQDHLHSAFKYVNNAAEGAAFQTLPRVLKRGKEIGYHTNHKTRGFPTRTFAAPVTING